MSSHIPFLDLSNAHAAIRTEMRQAFDEVYDSSWFILGERLKEFEESYAQFNGVAFAVGVSNGMDALFLALKALGIGPGDEVIVPSNTYIATALAVMHSGATPVLAEPDATTYNISSQAIANAITVHTRAIIPVHLYGQACDMGAIKEMADARNLHIIEDNAQAHGAAYDGRSTGAWGVLNATSFYPGKNLGALGDGGALTTDDSILAEKVQMLRNYGSARKYYHEETGFNMRLDEMQAAFLSVKLKQLPRWIAERREIAGRYLNGLQGVGDIALPHILPGATHVYHLFVIRTSQRDKLAEHLAKNGIATMVHYPVPLHLQKALSCLGHKPGSFPIAEQLAATCLSLPLWPGLNAGKTSFIIEKIKNFYD